MHSRRLPPRPARGVPIVAAVCLAWWALHATTTAATEELATTLAQAGARVEAFFTRAQSLICTETVSMQPLGYSFSPEGFGRTVESELRLSWDPEGEGAATEAEVERRVLKVNGRPPRENDPRNCTTPEQRDTETQPLSMLLPHQQQRFSFSLAGAERVDGRDALMVDFRETTPVSVDVRAVEGNDDCFSYDLTGGERGRLWIDRTTADVLRMEQRLIGLVDLRLPRALTRRPGTPSIITLERSDTTIRFARIAFTNPEESLVLPVSSSSLRVLRGGGVPRLRTITKYSDYRRFLTGARIIGAAPR